MEFDSHAEKIVTTRYQHMSLAHAVKTGLMLTAAEWAQISAFIACHRTVKAVCEEQVHGFTKPP
jgi:hypothetical protein